MKILSKSKVVFQVFFNIYIFLLHMLRLLALSFLRFSLHGGVPSLWLLTRWKRYVCHETRKHVSFGPANFSSNTPQWMVAWLGMRTWRLQLTLCHTAPPRLLFTWLHTEHTLPVGHFLSGQTARCRQQRHHKGQGLLYNLSSPGTVTVWHPVLLNARSLNFFIGWQNVTPAPPSSHPPPIPSSFPSVLAPHQICLCAILITAKAIFMVVFCENTNLQKRW